nr:cytochrome P450 2W1-like [Lytechinus pictus]
MRQVIDETLRVSVLAPFAARYQDFDVTLGGHLIRNGTPVIHALGVSFMSDRYFPNPKESVSDIRVATTFVHALFDPENFSSASIKSRPREAFQPFGFGGGRVCPGQQYTYKGMAIVLAVFLRAFKVYLVPGQRPQHSHGFVSHPVNEYGGDLRITVEKRGK